MRRKILTGFIIGSLAVFSTGMLFPKMLRAENAPGFIKKVRVGLHSDKLRLVVELDAPLPAKPDYMPGKVGTLILKGVMPSPTLHERLVVESKEMKKHLRRIVIRYSPANQETIFSVEGPVAGSSPRSFTLPKPNRIVIDFPFSALLSGHAKSKPTHSASTTKSSAPPAFSPRPGQKVYVIPGKKLSGKGDAPAASPSGKAVRFDSDPSRFRVVLDPGHGGKDCGTRSVEGTCEKDLVLDISKRVARLLRQDPRFSVFLTRDTDVFIPLKERTRMANRWKGDLYLSIHANADPDPSVRGIETFLLNLRSSDARARQVAERENSELGLSSGDLGAILLTLRVNHKKKHSWEFAQDIDLKLDETLTGPYPTVRDLGIRQAPFYVIMGTAMPAVLTEINFLSNRRDARLMADTAYREQVAIGLYRGIVQYYLRVHPEVQAQNREVSSR